MKCLFIFGCKNNKISLIIQENTLPYYILHAGNKEKRNKIMLPVFIKIEIDFWKNGR